MYDAVAISDIHLGSDNCQAKALVRFLEEVRRGPLAARRLVLNGDVFDSIDFRRLKKHHWNVLSEIRKLSDEVDVTWINGNHDGPADIVSHLLGVEVRDELVVESGGRRVLFLHGHRFDEFIARWPRFTRFADNCYRLLQWLDRTHTFARMAKKRSKVFLRSTEKIRAGAVRHAEKRECEVVCCGHTHVPVAADDGPVGYFNGGAWTERPCHFLTLKDGVVELHAYETEPVTVEEPAPVVALAVA